MTSRCGVSAGVTGSHTARDEFVPCRSSNGGPAPARSKASTVDFYTRIMPSGFVNRSIGRATSRMPGLRRVPVLKLLSIAEVGMLARDHVARLTPAERRRLLGLLRIARGRPSKLSTLERQELASLVLKLEPRMFVGDAANRLSPFPLPQRLVRGPRKRA